jgi:Homeobox associated leucine zipper
MSAMRQMPLFSASAEAHRTLQEHYDALAAYHETLFAEHQALQEELDALRRALAAAETRARCFATLVGERQGPTTPGQALEPFLKQLLILAHPDKWSQGQPASALAHDLSIHINALRQEVKP